MLVGAGMFVLCSCTSQGSQQKEVVTDSVSVSQVDPVIETIMSRRSIRKYKPKAVEREKMQTIVECGINAPNGMNKQSWEVRVVDNPEFINGLTEIFKKENPMYLANLHTSFLCNLIYPTFSRILLYSC